MNNILFIITTSDWIAVGALIISIASLYKSYWDNSIKLHVSIDRSDKETVVNFHNNSNRTVTITSFEIYSALSKNHKKEKRQYVHTAYNDNCGVSFSIEPHKFTPILFKDFYTINSTFFEKNLYVIINISGKPFKTVRASF